MKQISPLYAYAVITLVVLVFTQLAAGQAQEGNQGTVDDGSIDNGYFSYVSDMDSAASVREAMETLSWASKGSSWLMDSPEATPSEEAQAQATPASSESETPYGTSEAAVEATPTPATIASSDTNTKASSSNTLAIGLGVGIPLAVLSILSIAGLLIYKKRRATKKDFEKRTANLRHMSQTEV